MSKLALAAKNIVLSAGFSLAGPLSNIFQAQEEIKKPSMGSDEYWMLQALIESLSSIGITSPNPSIGCIIVDQNGVEISRGATQAYGGYHAERWAFQQVQDPDRLKGATVYVTLEPCSHFGKQPPCADLLIASKIQRVVISRQDINPKVNGAGIRALIQAGKQVKIGTYALESTASNCTFFANQILNRPVFILKWDQTVNGHINKSKGINNPAATIYSNWLRRRYDILLVDAKGALSKNSTQEISHHHLKLILDLDGICLRNPEVLNNKNLGYITTSKALEKNSYSCLKKQIGITVFELSGTQPLTEILTLLQSEQIFQLLGHPLQSILIEGESQFLSTWLSAGYADILHFFMRPQIGHELKCFPWIDLAHQTQKFDLVSTSQFNQDVLFELVSSEIAQKLFYPLLDKSNTI